MAAKQESSLGGRLRGLLHRRKSKPASSNEEALNFRHSLYEESMPGMEPEIGAASLKDRVRSGSSEQSRSMFRGRSSTSRPMSQTFPNTASTRTSVDAGRSNGYWQPSNSPAVPLRRPPTFAESTQDSELLKDLSRASFSDPSSERFL